MCGSSHDLGIEPPCWSFDQDSEDSDNYLISIVMIQQRIWDNDSDDYFNDTDVLASTGMANTAMQFGFCIELNALDIHSLSELLGILLCTK